jgi:hypothetical protein
LAGVAGFTGREGGRRAQRVPEAQRMQDMVAFMASIQIPGVVVPQSLLAPLVPPTPPTLGTSVSIYIWLLKSFSLCSPRADTNEFHSPLCSHSRRVRTRLLLVAHLHRSGCRVTLPHTPGGQVHSTEVPLQAPGGISGSSRYLWTLLMDLWQRLMAYGLRFA